MSTVDIQIPDIQITEPFKLQTEGSLFIERLAIPTLFVKQTVNGQITYFLIEANSKLRQITQCGINICQKLGKYLCLNLKKDPELFASTPSRIPIFWMIIFTQLLFDLDIRAL